MSDKEIFLKKKNIKIINMFVDDIDDEKQKLVEYRKNYSKIDKIKTGLFFY